MQNNSEILKETLAKSQLHNNWVDRYYSGRNNKFYEMAFDEISDQIDNNSEKTFLDAGCGNGAHSIRLAQRGFSVYAADFSEEALRLCKNNVIVNKLEKKISIHRENLLNFSFHDSSFDGALCWGVLMHISEVEKAIDELCRVVKPGGHLVLCENSMNSAETIFRNMTKKILGRKNTIDKKVVSGLECWYETKAGKFLVRKTDINWLIGYVRKNDFSLVKRMPGQFTELYSWINIPQIKFAIQYFNEFWFKYIKLPKPALGQILIFKKNKNENKRN